MSEQEQSIHQSQASYGNAERGWTTSIDKLRLRGISGLECTIERPDSGTARGGYLSVFQGRIGGQLLIRQYLEGQGRITVSAQDSRIEWPNHVYHVCYGPHYRDAETIVATSVGVFNGQAQNFQPAVCTPISDDRDQITAYFRFSKNPFGFGTVPATLIAREGSTFGEGRIVGSRTIRPEYPRGMETIDHLTLKPGATYNVTTNLYSSYRPVAGYVFTRPR